MRCWMRKMAAKLRGVTWDGHCMDLETGRCIDCGKQLVATQPTCRMRRRAHRMGVE